MSEISGVDLSAKENGIGLGVEVKKLWKENLNNFNLYHGTSVSIAQDISKNGLKGEGKPYDFDDKFFVENQAFLWGIRDEGMKYSMGKDTVFFVTCSERTACEYALSGPEMLRMHLLPVSKELMGKMEKGGGREKYAQDYKKVSEIKDRWLKQVVEHRPALVKIKKDSESYKEIISNRLGEKERNFLENYDSFYDFVEKFSRESGLSLEVAANSVIDNIKAKFFNEAVNGDLNPNDLEVVSGKEFDSLNQENLKFALIRKVCFGESMKEQPFELLSFIYKVIYYKTGTLKNLEGLLGYYEMSDKGREILESIAKLSGLLKSRGLISEV
jgi:hypothetical protein